MGKLVTPRSSSKQFFRRTNINKFQLQLVNKKPPEKLRAKFVKLIKTYQSSRTTTRVLTGNFMAAKRSASRAISSLTPSISNIILPGFTLQAQKSTEPLPLPIRTSTGLEVTGVSGKIESKPDPAVSCDVS